MVIQKNTNTAADESMAYINRSSSAFGRRLERDGHE